MATHASSLKKLRLILVGLIAVVSVTPGVPPAGAQDPGDVVPGRFREYDMLMKQRPALEFFKKKELGFPAGLQELWMKALKRPDPELQRLVIDSMAMAYAQNLQGLESAVGELVTLAAADNQDLDVLRAAVQTLVVLDVREHQELFARLATEKGAPISEIVEPALAKWRSRVMQEDWVSRVETQAASPSQIILAMNGIGELKAVQARDALQTLTKNSSALRRLRMTAARTLGKVDPGGQVELAKQILAQRSRPEALNALLALAAVEADDSAGSIAVLEGLVKNENSAVQSEALEHLYRIDPELLVPFIDELVESRDANVRWWCARTLVAGRDVQRVPTLSNLLNDLNPGLRRFVSRSLVEFCDSEDLRPAVIAETERVLAGNQWRGCEQACVVLGRRVYKPSAERMVELLGHPRGDVQVAAAWGLTQLRVAKTLPDILDHAESTFQGLVSKQLSESAPGVTLHLGHIFNAFGDQEYQPAEPLMRKFVPKSYDYGEFSRSAAVWALGMLHQGDADSDLVPILTERLLDDGGEMPEMDWVRIMSAVSLGRMKATSAVDSLQGYAGDTDLVGSASRWAVEQITGMPVPLPTLRDTSNTKDQWFLTPLPDDAN